MRRNEFLTDVVMKAKCYGFTDEEIQKAVKKGLEKYNEIKKLFREKED